ncbi:rhodanese-like domain-containing protein [Mucilaginibacter sp.]|jgi:hypothetical protein|uniref:rhodanese-like domain-containing protein n=1 Tax=Mucilaginibacter sp. TaxID=1882438 RepID=UPI002BCD6DDF|nr:rhodanese-like domain-containing protein [Mucilaginibacter sp.]HTI58235.1 hypothetical protein [Mucilaginibacter sp.]
MKRNPLKPLLFSILLILLGITSKAQVSKDPNVLLGLKKPWASNELIEPSALAADLKNNSTATPLIFNIGAVENIKGARHIGAASNAENLEKLKNTVKDLPQNTAIVIYCGCCPFSKCPNVSPAYLELKKLGFSNVKVLDLATNLKTDWIDKGYPLGK